MYKKWNEMWTFVTTDFHHKDIFFYKNNFITTRAWKLVENEEHIRNKLEAEEQL